MKHPIPATPTPTPSDRNTRTFCRHRRRPSGCDGFTARELVAVVGALALLAALAVPVLANSKLRSQRAVCANNLALIGRAFALWSNEHGDRYPAQLDWVFGGTRNHPSALNNNAWFQFAWLSNELVTPRILACPSDPKVIAAGDFSVTLPDGFLEVHHLNNSLSYIFGFPYQEDGRLILSGDRTIHIDGFGSSSSGLSPVAIIDPQSPLLRWLPGVHPASGNLLFNDNSVDQVDDVGLRLAFAGYPAFGSSAKSRPAFLYPRPPLP